MAKKTSDGLVRLQQESRISATTWRQWCDLLKVDYSDAIELWSQVCHPIMVVTRKVPEIPFILQLRATRPEVEIAAFKEEVGKILHFTTFIHDLHDDCLTRGKVKSSLLKLYRQTFDDNDENYTVSLNRFLIEACMITVVTKIMKGSNVTLSGLLKPLVERRASIEQILNFGLQSLSDSSYEEEVRECLDNLFLNSASEKDADNADNEVNGVEEDDEDIVLEKFVGKFKAAMQAIYEVSEENGPAGGSATVARERSDAIASFDLLSARIPSLTEAIEGAQKAEIARNPTKPRRATISEPLSPPGSSSGSNTTVGGGDGGAVETIGGSSGTLRDDTNTTGSNLSDVTKPAAPQKNAIDERANTDKIAIVNVDPSDEVHVANLTLLEFNERARQICSQMATIEKSDQVVWNLFIDPTVSVKDIRALSRTVSKEGTPTHRAYVIIKTAVQLIQLKNLLPVSQKAVKKDGNFMLEVSQLFNFANNSHRELEPEARQVRPLARILDHAGGALVRLETLRINLKFSSQHQDEYTRNSVTVYYEEALRAVTDLVDRKVLSQARERADRDTTEMLQIFEAQKFVDQTKLTIATYVQRMVAENYVIDVESLKSEFESDPIQLEGKKTTDQISSDLVQESELGETFDTVCKYVCQEAWFVLKPEHNPKEAIMEISTMLRELLVGSATYRSERKRHQERPGLALAVVSLDKISGNGNLKDLYVRVQEDGKIHFLENFEDGSFADLFELREYKPIRIASAAKKEAEEEESEQLHTGRKYLFTIGRTNKLFGDSPADIVNNCVRNDDGGPMVFPAF